MAIIELHEVDKVYGGAIDCPVLFNINLSFQEGSFSSLIGPSGSGKSTLLHLMGTLDRPTRGEVFVNGRRTEIMSRDQLAELRNEFIGFVFQFHYLLPEFTALENVMMPHWIRGDKNSDAAMRRANELFALAGILEVRDNLATRMSGGEQQRTAIVRALINEPRIVLADEPSGNLDTENTKIIYQLFRDINKRFGTTFVIVTHDRRIAEKTDRIVEIRDGRIVNDSSIA